MTNLENLFNKLNISEKTKMSQLDEILTLINRAVFAATQNQAKIFNEKISELNNKISALQVTTGDVEEFKEIIIDPSVVCNESLDLVKSLPEFEGKIAQYVSWRQAAHTAYRVYENFNGSSKYYQAVAIIRTKIRGAADAVLASFSTVLNFQAIIARLDFTYADKRPIYLIEQELSTLRQGTKSVFEFYDQVEQKLNLLTNKTAMTYEPNIVQIVNEKYRADALRTFISGLKKPLCDILFSSRPSNLPTALALAQEVEANHERYIFAASFANRSDISNKPINFNEDRNIKKGQIPLINHEPFKKSQSFEKNPYFVKAQNQTSQPPPRQFQPNKPEPMDVDPSTSRFRQWTNGRQQNYETQKAEKRYNESGRYTGPKVQRINQTIQDEDQYTKLSEEEVLDLEVGVDNVNFLGVNPSYPS